MALKRCSELGKGGQFRERYSGMRYQHRYSQQPGGIRDRVVIPQLSTLVLRWGWRIERKGEGVRVVHTASTRGNYKKCRLENLEIKILIIKNKQKTKIN